jgi:hypothetical protein
MRKISFKWKKICDYFFLWGPVGIFSSLKLVMQHAHKFEFDMPALRPAMHFRFLIHKINLSLRSLIESKTLNFTSMFFIMSLPCEVKDPTSL